MSQNKLSLNYAIRSYECDQNNNLRLVTLMNILQEAAVKDAANRGFGLEECIKNNMTWVGNDYVIDILRNPKVDETITVTTWPSAKDKMSAGRDFMITDAQGKIIVKATSRWLLISLDKKRPLPVDGFLGEKYHISEHIINTDFPKIPEVSADALHYDFKVRYDDIDINKHINNAVYVLWAGEAVEHDWRTTRTPAKIAVNFRKEGFWGEEIEVLSQVKETTVYSSVRAKGENARELARVAIEWK